MFNVDSWAADMRAAIAARDAESLARLMYENDRNGCFSYVDVCNEFGEMTYEKWYESTIEYAVKTMSDHHEHAATI